MTRVACIDIGTVTARLAVADVEGGRVARLIKHSEICNLGEGVDATGRLRDDAIGRVFSCVRGYVALAVEAGAPAACCTLTSAARDAENSDEMVSVLESLGLSPLVIPGRIEGSLTFLGVAQDFRGRRILVADNGGGSTELALGSLGEDGALDLSYVRSVDVGCRRVTEKYLQAVPLPTADDLAAAHAFVAEGFAPAVEEGGLWAAGSERAVADAPEALVVCGGTVTSLVAVDAEMEPYDSARVHLAGLTREKVEALEKRLAGLTVEQRAELPGLQAKRAPVILGGAVAISELMRQTSFSTLQASESDLLFGLALTAAASLDGTASPVGWRPEMHALPERPLR